jgi:hypothetical protein
MILTIYKNIEKPIEYFTSILIDNYLAFFPFIDFYILLEKESKNIKYYMKYNVSKKLIPITYEKIYTDNTGIGNICNMMDLSTINFAYMFSKFRKRENVVQKFEKKYLLEIASSGQFNKEFQDSQYIEMIEKLNDESFVFAGENAENAEPHFDRFQYIDPNGSPFIKFANRFDFEPLTKKEIKLDLQLEKETELDCFENTTISREIFGKKSINVIRKNIMKKYTTIVDIINLLVNVEDECKLNIMIEKNMEEWEAMKYIMDTPEIMYNIYHERAQEYLNVK